MGKYPACRARDAGRCIRLYYQTLEQRSVDARIETALELTSQDKKAAVPVEDNDGFNRSHIIGKSKALMDVLATIKRIARTNASVLITGESGTGKELIAEAVHLNSPRSKKPL